MKTGPRAAPGSRRFGGCTSKSSTRSRCCASTTRGPCWWPSSPLLRKAPQTTHLQQIAEGDLVFSYCAVAMTHCGPFAGVAPSGKRITLELWSLDEVRDGLVVQHNSASTWADVLRQLGVPAFRLWPPRMPGVLRTVTYRSRRWCSSQRAT